MFINHFIANFPQNALVRNLKIGHYLANIWAKVYGLLICATGPPCISLVDLAIVYT